MSRRGYAVSKAESYIFAKCPMNRGTSVRLETAPTAMCGLGAVGNSAYRDVKVQCGWKQRLSRHRDSVTALATVAI